MRTQGIIPLLVCLACFGAGISLAQGAAQLAQQDKEFATAALAGGQAEVELGRLAMRKGGAEVKDFGHRMVKDHRDANRKLLAILHGSGIPGSKELPTNTRKDIEQLSKLPSKDFDQQYLQKAVSDHDKTVALFADEAEAGENAELKKYANAVLPTIREHLAMARDLLGKVAGQAGSAANSGTSTAHDRAHTNFAAARPDYPLAERTAADLIGLQVLNKQGDDVGTLKEIVMDTTNGAVIGVVSVGGYLAVGDKDVGIDFRNLRPAPGAKHDSAIVMESGGKADLKSLQPFNASAEKFIKYPDNRKIGEIGKP